MIKKYKGNQYQTRKAWNLYHPNDIILNGSGFVIHHIDKNPKNNIRENLCKLTVNQHAVLHNTGRCMSENAKRKISIANKNRQTWLGKKHTEESKRKMSEKQSGEKHHLFGKKRPINIGRKISASLKSKYAKEPHYLLGRERPEHSIFMKNFMKKIYAERKLKYEHKLDCRFGQ